MIKFTKPKVNEIRYVSFMSNYTLWWVYKVKINKVGTKWITCNMLEYITGSENPYKDNMNANVQLYYWHYQKTLEDAYKMLIYNIFDTRDVELFYREQPDLGQII